MKGVITVGSGRFAILGDGQCMGQEAFAIRPGGDLVARKWEASVYEPNGGRSPGALGVGGQFRPDHGLQ
jgi:hypothetical protein